MSDIPPTTLRRAIAGYDASYPPEVLGLEPNPRITSLSPSTVSAAAGATTITVAGSNFTATSVVEINQAAQTTTYVSPTSLTVSYDPTVAGPVTFTVRDGEGESNSVVFNVTALAALSVEPEAEVPTPSLAEQIDSMTVAEVQALVSAHPDLLGEVSTIERAGKARSTLLAWLDAYGAEPEAAAESMTTGDYVPTDAERETGPTL